MIIPGHREEINYSNREDQVFAREVIESSVVVKGGYLR
jgi:hypothetical protein